MGSRPAGRARAVLLIAAAVLVVAMVVVMVVVTIDDGGGPAASPADDPPRRRHRPHGRRGRLVPGRSRRGSGHRPVGGDAHRPPLGPAHGHGPDHGRPGAGPRRVVGRVGRPDPVHLPPPARRRLLRRHAADLGRRRRVAHPRRRARRRQPRGGAAVDGAGLHRGRRRIALGCDRSRPVRPSWCSSPSPSPTFPALLSAPAFGVVPAAVAGASARRCPARPAGPTRSRPRTRRRWCCGVRRAPRAIWPRPTASRSTATTRRPPRPRPTTAGRSTWCRSPPTR